MPCFLPYSWSIFSLDTGFWVDSTFLSVLKKYCATFFWSPCFLTINLLSLEMLFLMGKVSLFSGCFQNLFSVFRSLIMMCLGVDFFGLVLCRVHLASWICRFTSLVKFSAIISSSFLSAPFSSPSRTLMTELLVICYNPTGP